MRINLKIKSWIGITLLSVLWVSVTIARVAGANEAFEDAKTDALKGDAKSQCKLGNYYFLGNGMPANPEEAVKWYEKAADQDYAVAEYNLGYCYYTGKGGSTNSVEAVKWFQKAADH